MVNGAGRLRDRAEFLRAAVTVDALGGQSKDFSPLFSAWGHLAEQSGREAMQSGEVRSTRTAVLTVRKMTDAEGVTPDDRVTVRGTTWNIRAVSQPDVRGKWLEMVLEGPI